MLTVIKRMFLTAVVVTLVAAGGLIILLTPSCVVMGIASHYGVSGGYEILLVGISMCLGCGLVAGVTKEVVDWLDGRGDL